MKLNPSEIYFQHLYHKTKLYLINTSKIISFLNTKHLFKHFISPNTYQSNTYFTHITCSNFLSNKQYALISLTKHKYSNELFSYRADYISTLSDQIEIKQSLISKINTYLTRDYYLDTYSFTGNPYILKSYTNQYQDFTIDSDNLVGVEGFKFFCNGFKPLSDEEKLDDLFLKNVSITPCHYLTSEEK